jgi:hypothetical protein
MFDAERPQGQRAIKKAARHPAPKLYAEEGVSVLHEFITMHRDAIIGRTRDRMRSRTEAAPSADELETGVPLFLTQLTETLVCEMAGTPFAAGAIAASAALRGGELRALGFNVSQVVHDYGDICQAITETAIDQQAGITVEEFRILNRCLDTAIAEAVTEHARMTAQVMSSDRWSPIKVS